MLGKIMIGASALFISIVVAGCSTTDLDYGTLALPVIEQDAFLAAGGWNAYEFLGAVSVQSDNYPGDPAARRQQILHYLTRDAKRDYPQAETLVLQGFHDLHSTTIGLGRAVRRK